MFVCVLYILFGLFCCERTKIQIRYTYIPLSHKIDDGMMRVECGFRLGFGLGVVDTAPSNAHTFSLTKHLCKYVNIVWGVQGDYA